MVADDFLMNELVLKPDSAVITMSEVIVIPHIIKTSVADNPFLLCVIVDGARLGKLAIIKGEGLATFGAFEDLFHVVFSLFHFDFGDFPHSFSVIAGTAIKRVTDVHLVGIVSQELGFVLVPLDFLLIQNTAALYAVTHNAVQRVKILTGGDYLTAGMIFIIVPVAQNIDFFHFDYLQSVGFVVFIRSV